MSLLPFTMRHKGEECPHYIVPGAVTYATASLPGKNGMVGAIIGIMGAGRIETWEGGTTQSEIDNLMDAVRKTKTLFEYKPEVAHSRWYEPAALYIDPASVTRMQGALNGNQIDVFFNSGGSLDVKVAYHNQFDPKTSFEKKALDIYTSKKYAGPDQGAQTLQSIFEQLQKEAFQARVDFVRKIAAANGDLLDISTRAQAAFLRKEDIRMVSFGETKDSGTPILYVWSKEKQNGFGGDSFSLQFNTAAEREAVLAIILQSNAPKKINPKLGFKP